MQELLGENEELLGQNAGATRLRMRNYLVRMQELLGPESGATRLRMRSY